jgi:uncharacterized protein YbaP (TraB family)
MLFSRLNYRRLARGATAAVLAALQGLAFAQTGSTPLIWEVRSPTNTVYLFGTIHVGARKMYPLSSAVEQAYAAAHVLALEADPTDQAAAVAAVQRSTYTPPDNLANHVSPMLMEDVKKTLPAVGLPIEYARAMRPDLLAMTIAMMEIGRHGYDANLGLDMHFARLAKRDGKRIVELESIAGQIDLLGSFSPELQEAMLRTTVDSVRDGSLTTDTHELVSAWSAGDSARLMDQVDKEVDGLPEKAAAEMRERLYDVRNREMAGKVIAMLAGADPTFIAVGAGHLLGDTGIVELLRRKGYAIRRL